MVRVQSEFFRILFTTGALFILRVDFGAGEIFIVPIDVTIAVIILLQWVDIKVRQGGRVLWLRDIWFTGGGKHGALVNKRRLIPHVRIGIDLGLDLLLFLLLALQIVIQADSLLINETCSDTWLATRSLHAMVDLVAARAVPVRTSTMRVRRVEYVVILILRLCIAQI